MNSANWFLFLQALLHFLLRIGTALDAITISQHIRDGGDVLLSDGKTFEFGFFTPGKSTYRHVGIRYHSAPEKPVVWVANRDTPIKDTSGVLSIDVHGDLVLQVEGRNTPIWSTNTVSKSRNNTLAQLKDSGNLVLIDNNGTGKILWQSFDHPTHVMLPGMKLGIDRRTGLDRFLTSWKSEDNPGTGNWSYRLAARGFPEFFLFKNKTPWWRTGHWNGQGWSGVPLMGDSYFMKYSLVNNQSETTVTCILSTNFQIVLVYFILEASGSILQYVCPNGVNNWSLLGTAPRTDGCDTYGECGAFGKCNPSVSNESKCTCLPGFLRNASGECVRKREEASLCGSGDRFEKVAKVKVPDGSVGTDHPSLSLEACRQLCLKNCSCVAYASVDMQEEGGCITWSGDLKDTRVFPSAGQDLYVRVGALELGKKSEGFFAKKRKLAILVVAILVTSFLAIFFVWWLIKRKSKGSREQLELFNDDIASSGPLPGPPKLDGSRRKPDLPFFDLSTVVAATDNFSPAKRLGQGGFGPVYGGQLANGQEIAVKTLSRSSRQGTEEFKNEVKLIAKLQHRNLVRLLACCIHKEEKMLIYEYMPNKSLDFFIFDEVRRKLIDWRKRFEIISGITRGVLYLHQDSRLKIIHRDLKASNILLDAAMNPKISDFGLAKMFGDDQIEANTRRVVGTYGYMSPEYAMEGLYSIKSDVFSFGILILEIISGKKNNYYHAGSPYLNLIGYAWGLWTKGKALDLVDSCLGQEYSDREVLRCIQIGLLCVQEQAMDRPTMPEVVVMLGNEATITSPKKPAFIKRAIKSGPDSSGSGGAPPSINEMTVSVLHPR